MVHELKILPEYFEAVRSGRKKFEVRIDDRGYAEGDILVLKEWDPVQQAYTSRLLVRQVTYILRGPEFGIANGYVVMSILCCGGV